MTSQDGGASCQRVHPPPSSLPHIPPDNFITFAQVALYIPRGVTAIQQETLTRLQCIYSTDFGSFPSNRLAPFHPARSPRFTQAKT